jgi:hypothetical protein
MALLEKILNVPEVLGRGIPSPLFSLPLLLISFNMSSTESFFLAIFYPLSLKDLMLPSLLSSMLMTPSWLCKLMRISWSS